MGYWSPLPPQSSGIADYSFEMLKSLSVRARVTAVVDDVLVEEVQTPDGVEVVAASDAFKSRFDVQVFHMGNNAAFHAYMLGPALRTPGVLHLHDASLYDLVYAVAGGHTSSTFREELRFDMQAGTETIELPTIRLDDGLSTVDRSAVLLARRLIERHPVTFVHSPGVAAALIDRYGADVRAVPLPASRDSFVWHPPLPGDQTRFGTFGGITRFKRVAQVVEAFLEVHAQNPLTSLVIAGRSEDPVAIEQVRQLIERAEPSARRAIALQVDLPLSELHDQMRSCDVVIGLRWPSTGEMSAILPDALAMGKPLVVSDLPQYRHFDRSWASFVPVGDEAERASLVQVMGELARAPQRLARASASARDFALAHLQADLVADELVEVFHEVAIGKAPIASGVEVAAPFGFGVNAVGSWRSATGIAEAARRTVIAAQRAGCAVVLTEAESGSHARLSRLPPELESMPTTPGFDIDVCFLNLNEIYDLPDRYRRAERGSNWLIACGWAWETSGIGRAVIETIEKFDFDAAFVPSEYVLTVVERALGIDVYRVPHVVNPVPDDRWDRSHFGVDPKRPLVLFSFDAYSDVRRKNPLGAIEAFRRAFGPGEDQPAQLVLKSSNLGSLPEANAAVRAALNEVGGVLIDEYLSPGEMHQLMNLCDVYLSLHRAEGFGLGMAEAMALGKLVIATDHSGSTDFVKRGHACPVACRIVPNQLGDHYLNPGIATLDLLGDTPMTPMWAEPDVDDAARWLRWAIEHPDSAHALGARAATFVQDNYNERAVGRAFIEAVVRVTGADHARRATSSS